MDVEILPLLLGLLLEMSDIHSALCLPCGNVSPMTALAAAAHKSVGLNFTWSGELILKQMSVPLGYLLSQPPQQHHCSRKQ